MSEYEVGYIDSKQWVKTEASNLESCEENRSAPGKALP